MTGENILDGVSSLSLTTSSLVVLNECFASISEDDLTTSFEVLPGTLPRLTSTHDDVQFLYDFVQKVQRLKVGNM